MRLILALTFALLMLIGWGRWRSGRVSWRAGEEQRALGGLFTAERRLLREADAVLYERP
jgi:hypothetical protein